MTIVKCAAYIILTLMFSLAFACDDDVPIKSDAELLAWCKEESESYFVANEKTPYNWTASWWTKGNILLVEGMWRVDGDDIVVKCRIVSGAKRKYAVYELVNKNDLE